MKILSFLVTFLNSITMRDKFVPNPFRFSRQYSRILRAPLHHGVNDRTRRIIIVTRRVLAWRLYEWASRIRALIIFIICRPRAQLTQNSVPCV